MSAQARGGRREEGRHGESDEGRRLRFEDVLRLRQGGDEASLHRDRRHVDHPG